MGKVPRPGVYAIEPDALITLRRAVAAAGGAEKDFKSCQIVHREGEAEQTSDVNLKDVMDGKAPDPGIRPNDVIHVR